MPIVISAVGFLLGPAARGTHPVEENGRVSRSFWVRMGLNGLRRSEAARERRGLGFARRAAAHGTARADTHGCGLIATAAGGDRVATRGGCAGRSRRRCRFLMRETRRPRTGPAAPGRLIRQMPGLVRVHRPGHSILCPGRSAPVSFDEICLHGRKANSRR
jgi:hypothetical protein